MSRRIKDYVDIKDHSSLDDLICKLIELRDSLPEDAGAELRLRGDDIFGRKLSISYFRELTPDEAECEARYANLSVAESGRDEGPAEKGWRDVA
jgi:hypothetical protein